ncbi:hypothetical protein [Mycobacterium sp.]
MQIANNIYQFVAETRLALAHPVSAHEWERNCYVEGVSSKG